MDLPICPRPSMGLPWEDCTTVPCAFSFRKATEMLRGTEDTVQEVPLVCHGWCCIQTLLATWIHDEAMKSSFGNSPSAPSCALIICPFCSPVPMPGQCLLARIAMQPCRFVKCLWGEDASTCPVSERLHDPAWWKRHNKQSSRSMEWVIRTVMGSLKPQQRIMQWRNSPTANSAKFQLKTHRENKEGTVSAGLWWLPSLYCWFLNFCFMIKVSRGLRQV